MQQQFLTQIVARLKQIGGLRAIVLGGSYASGTQRPDSDLDLGLYYWASAPLDVSQVRALAADLNDNPDPVVTELGGWGPWVNGGAWLTIQGQRVDLLYRNLDFVAGTIDECNAGIIRSDYWQQPAYGFHSYMYCTETAICRPLYDPEHLLDGLKAKVTHYSPQLQAAISKTFLWSARFTLDNAQKPAKRGEVYLVAGCLARAIHCLVQVLYAVNETYYMSEKRLAADLHTFKLKPAHLLERITAILGEPGTTAAQLEASLAAVEALYREVDALPVT